MKGLALFVLPLAIALGAVAQKKKDVVVGDQSAISYEQGKALYDKDKYNEAIAYFEESIKSNASEDCLYYLGLSYRYTSQPEKAIAALKRLEKVNPNYWA